MTFSGIDLVLISRFISWLNKPEDEVLRIFSAYEIQQLHARMTAAHDEARSQIGGSFLASRFAVKEAAYKALSELLVDQGFAKQSFSFKAFAPHTWTTTDGIWGVPKLVIDHECFEKMTGIQLPQVLSSVSLSHDGEYATAIVSLSSLPLLKK